MRLEATTTRTIHCKHGLTIPAGATVTARETRGGQWILRHKLTDSHPFTLPQLLAAVTPL